MLSPEVAELCAFLASEKSSYVSGALIEITGECLHTYPVSAVVKPVLVALSVS